MKKFLALLLVLVIGITAGIGGTIAYLTDTKEAVNVMTAGNVKIEQQEWQRADGVTYNNDGKPAEEGDLVPFVQGQLILPAVPLDSSAYTAEPTKANGFQWGDYVTADGAWNGLWNENKIANVMDKIVMVKNTGNTGAYYRTIFAFECPEGMTYGQGSKSDFMMNFTSYKGFVKETLLDHVTINGTEYMIQVATYQNVLTPGETSRPSLLQVLMTDHVTSEQVALLGDTYDILVLSQAVQTGGFETLSADDALNAAFGDVTAENAAAWFGGEEFAIPTVVSNADELIKALEKGEDVVLTEDVKIDPANMSNAYGATGINVLNGQTIDGGGNTLDIKGAGGTWDSGINTTGGLIKNITITGSFRGIFINHNSDHSEPVVLENVTIDGTTYTISCDQGENQTLTATNCTFNGWTSYAATLGRATFTDCSFGEGNGYAYCRPYAPTTFVGCDFEAGYEMDARAAVTFENCTIGGVALTADNLATLVTSNIANATVK